MVIGSTNHSYRANIYLGNKKLTLRGYWRCTSSKKEDTNSLDIEDVFYQNEDDCFGIYLDDD